MLRQILNFCPDFYEIRWQEAKYKDPTLCIRFVSGVKTINFNDQQARQKDFEKKILEHSLKVHGEFLKTKMIEQFEDPVKTQQWHPDFKDWDQVPELPLAVLPQMAHHSVGHKSTSVNEFVSKMGNSSSLVQQALRISHPEQEEEKVSDEFLEMSTKYGISAETLRLIKQKQMLQEATKAEIKANEDPDKIALQELTSLQEELRQIFTSKSKQVLGMSDLIQNLTESRSCKGKFSSRAVIQKQLGELISLVPEFLESKNFKGRQMVRFKNKPSCEVI